MFLLKSRKQKPVLLVERLLTEFPWLWAVKPQWFDSNEVTIVRVNLETAKKIAMQSIVDKWQEPEYNEYQKSTWWMKCRYLLAGEGYEVGKIDFKPDISPFKSAALNLIEAKTPGLLRQAWEIEAVVSTTRASAIVYLAENGCDLHNICCNVC